MRTRTATMVLLALAAAACTEEVTVSKAPTDDEIPTVTQRVTADGSYEVNSDSFSRWVADRTPFPVRFRTVDVDGNVVNEYVAHSADEIGDRLSRAREARRVAAGRSPEEEAARRAASQRQLEERFPGLRERVRNR